jgi:STAM-binding protein
MLSNDPSVNPQFANWNMVWMKYCDGNSFAGALSTPISYNNGTANVPLNFRGHYILEAVVDSLYKNTMNAPVPFTQSYDIVLTGCSAGGLATYLHSDWWGSQIPAIRPPPVGSTLTRNGFYGSVPISGYFLDAASMDASAGHVYANEIQVIFGLSNATYGVNDRCITAHTPTNDQWKCNMAPYTYPYIVTPLFPLNSFYDSWQTGCILTSEPVQVPAGTVPPNGNCSAAPGWQNCAKDPKSCTPDQITNGYLPYGVQMRSDFTVGSKKAALSGSGGFLCSAHTHCEAQDSNAWTGFAINGISMRDSVAAWFNDNANTNGNAPASSHWHFDCQYTTTAPYSCNPTMG